MGHGRRPAARQVARADGVGQSRRRPGSGELVGGAVVPVPAAVARVLAGDELAAAMAAVSTWRDAEDQVAARRRQLVDDMRGRGASWAAVGWVLGTTGEAARLRFGRRP